MNTDFYNECAEILETKHHGMPFPHWYRTRWNNRIAGQGRFEGCGIIRCFGSTVHIALTHPISTFKIVSSKQEALEFLRTI